MDADLFKPADAAALLAIRAALDSGRLARDELSFAFQASGLIPPSEQVPAAPGSNCAVVRTIAQPGQ